MSRPEKEKIYNDIIALCPGIERKGKSMPYTSDNGHMFSQLNKDGEIGIRFSKEVQEKYLKSLNTTKFKSYGAEMKGYIVVPEPLLTYPEKVAELLKESQAYVLGLDPK